MSALQQVQLPHGITIVRTSFKLSRVTASIVARDLFLIDVVLDNDVKPAFSLGELVTVQVPFQNGLGEITGTILPGSAGKKLQVHLHDEGRVFQRRAYPRRQVESNPLPAWIDNVDTGLLDDLTITPVNVSGSGMLFSSKARLATGTRLVVQLMLGNGLTVSPEISVLAPAEAPVSVDESDGPVWWYRGLFSNIWEHDLNAIVEAVSRKQSENVERRKHSRHEVHLPSMLATKLPATGDSDKFFSIRVVDMSIGGMLFESTVDLQSNERIRLFFSIKEADDLAPDLTVLESAAPSEGGIPRFRAFFTTMSEAAQSHVQRIIADAVPDQAVTWEPARARPVAAATR